MNNNLTSSEQAEFYNKLCELNGAQVANIFANFYGMQLFTKEFKQFCIDEEFIYFDEE